jgi:hypothetical protein
MTLLALMTGIAQLLAALAARRAKFQQEQQNISVCRTCYSTDKLIKEQQSNTAGSTGCQTNMAVTVSTNT